MRFEDFIHRGRPGGRGNSCAVVCALGACRAGLLAAALCLALATSPGCRDDEKDVPEAPAATLERSAPEAAAAGTEAGRTLEPPETKIDPAKREKLTTGHQGERLLAKYELLIERIRKEKREKVFNNIRTIANGLTPIAGEHHELYEEGVIDSLTHDSFVKLGIFVMSHHIMSSDDPFGVQAGVMADSIRARIRRGPAGTPAEPDSAPPR